MSSRLHTICRNATCFVAALLLGSLAGHAFARRPAIPIEVIGVIKSFDPMNQIFTIQTDKPAKVLMIAVGRDCKFKHNGIETGERILKPGARVHVNYFATIFSGNIALEIKLTGRDKR